MDSTEEIREFLTSRRARLTPQQAGIPDFGGRRRVPGLRREEVAMLAGMSAEYYKRLERGNAVGVSEGVLDGIARALQLDEPEHSYLQDLVRAANVGLRATRTRRGSRTPQLRASMRQTIDAMSTVPVFVQNGRLDAIATNHLGHALFADMLDGQTEPVNAARFTFLDPHAQTFYRDWEANARQLVAVLRAEAGRAPFDRSLTDLVGELSTRSDLFRRLWASHDVRAHQTGLKRMHHRVVGDIDLTFEAVGVASDPDLTMILFTAEPSSPSHDRLQLLAAWSAPASAGDPLGRSAKAGES